MPRVRRRGLKRTGYTREHVFQLLVGHDFFSTAFGDDLEAMRAAWPTLRGKVYEALKARSKHGGYHRLRPWGWWEFDAPETRALDVTEVEQLERLGLLTDDDRAEIALQQGIET